MAPVLGPGPVLSPVIIPLGTERPSTRRPIVTLALIGLNMAAFVAFVGFAKSQATSIEEGAEGVVARFAYESGKAGEWWRLITCTFLHSPTDWLHIAGNMLFLWVFGPSVEGRLGRVGFSVLYVLGAVGASLSHGMVSSAPVIGASGAVAAVSGAFIILYPRVPFRILLFFFLVGVYTIPAYWFILAAIARDFLGMAGASGVSHAAHLGGYAVGMVGMALLLATGVLKREPQYDLISIFKHKQRLREFRAANELNSEREKRVKANGTAEKNAAKAKPELSSADSDAIAKARAAVSSELSKHDLPAAIGAYKALLTAFPKGGTAIILSRQNQLAIANALFEAGEHATALPAYRHFLVMYAKDPQAAHVRLMIGLIRTRYVPEAGEARREIEAAMADLADEGDVALARQLLGELGPVASATGGGPVSTATSATTSATRSN